MRLAAITGLRRRSGEAYSGALLEAFRYPWPAVADRARDAITLLQRRDLAPKLVDFLGEPDPSDPLVIEREGEKVTQVRELVRINHHRNCMLCHAPAENARGRRDVLGVVPSPAEGLPPSSSVVYYSAGPGQTVVRASVTYLRQDFSLLQPVAGAYPWPEMQRFDFLVRTRELSPGEVQAFAERKAARDPGYLSENHRAALAALRALTGKDLGADPAAWRRELAVTGERGSPECKCN